MFAARVESIGTSARGASGGIEHRGTGSDLVWGSFLKKSRIYPINFEFLRSCDIPKAKGGAGKAQTDEGPFWAAPDSGWAECRHNSETKDVNFGNRRGDGNSGNWRGRGR